MNIFSVTLGLLLVDALGVSVAWWSLYHTRITSGMYDPTLQPEMFGPAVVLILFWWVMFAVRGLYKPLVTISRFQEVERLFKAVATGTLILFVATIDVGKPEHLTRFFLLDYAVVAFIGVAAGRFALRTHQRKQRQRGAGLWNAIIVGANETGFKLHHQLADSPVWGFKVIGFVDDSPERKTHLGMPLLGGRSSLLDIIGRHNPSWILIAPEKNPGQTVSEVIELCGASNVRFMLVADHYQMVVGLVRTMDIHGLPLIEVHPQLVPLGTRVGKRLFDIFFSTIAAILILLLLPFIAVAIKVDSRGPVFYTQLRMGKRGREFRLFKFRSMVVDAETASGAVWALKNDPRVTRVGKFLRMTHLDELPQFFNILLGQMSLVGPRPERREFVEQFRKSVPLYERRLKVRPGLTGWAQVRHKYDETIEDVVEKVRYDLYYIDNVTLSLDIRILLLTALRVAQGLGHH